MVIDAGPKNTTNEDTLRSERRSALKKTIDGADIVRDVRLNDSLFFSLAHEKISDTLAPRTVFIAVISGRLTE